MTSRPEDATIPPGRHIATRARIGLHHIAGGKDPLILNENHAGTVAAVVIGPDP